MRGGKGRGAKKQSQLSYPKSTVTHVSPSWTQSERKTTLYVEEDEDDDELPPVSKLRDGLFIGNYEAAMSQDV
jgi:hypothetical protein